MDNINDWFVYGFSVFFCIYVLLYVRAKSRKKASKPKEPEIKIENYQAKMLDAENDILLRLEQASREISSQIDNKISLLNVLVEEADKRIMELQQLEAKPAVNVPSQAEPTLKIPNNADIRTKVKQLSEAGMSNNEIAKHLKMLEGEVKLILSISR